MLDLIARYKHLIKSFHVLLYEQERESFRLKAQVMFTDSSNLFVKEYLFENKERKYSYHCSDSLGNLICRWDNANHWVDIPTHPHHKHIGDDVFESIETSIDDVLSAICEKLEK
jgi:hypothetical protein